MEIFSRAIHYRLPRSANGQVTLSRVSPSNSSLEPSRACLMSSSSKHQPYDPLETGCRCECRCPRCTCQRKREADVAHFDALCFPCLEPPHSTNAIRSPLLSRQVSYGWPMRLANVSNHMTMACAIDSLWSSIAYSMCSLDSRYGAHGVGRP